ncbi:metallophosphoesterase family protein [Bariatricus sp. SGI.154]|uniref:metallophosphoesterase family protein n=1 Tax=Bariatricus sp. SGI.154 TaxID=3420549 RepID=UPI003D08661C
MHIADIHLGASPDAGNSYSEERPREIWESLRRVIGVCNEEEADVLLIAGDLFHRQPLLRELKEVNYLFGTLEHTQVVLIAGNHDYLKKDSYYRTFSWGKNVHMLLDAQITCVEIPELTLAVYGCSYHAKEITEHKYDDAFPQNRQKYEILLAHGGDEKHIPIQKDKLDRLGYDYIALGHIHKPQELIGKRAIYAGALEPIDKNDIGPHGYVIGEITDQGCKARFVKSASREYIHLDIMADKKMTGHSLKDHIRKRIEECGPQNIYKVTLRGFRDPDILFDPEMMDSYGNIIELVDDTKPAYDLERLMAQNKDNLLGKYIESLKDYDEDSVEYLALCEGVQALMETRRG